MAKSKCDDLPNCEGAAILRALGHPARLQIIRSLADRGHCCCGEIVNGLPLVQSTVSQHLKVLKEAGLIEGAIDGPRSTYCLNLQKLELVRELLDELVLTRNDQHVMFDEEPSKLGV